MKLKAFFLSTIFLGLYSIALAAFPAQSSELGTLQEMPGPGDKEKKDKKEDKEPKGKMSKTKYKPSKHARLSAKAAKRSTKMKDKQIMGRARTRNFFHKSFNTKFGKPVNFRSKRQRNRWKRGR